MGVQPSDGMFAAITAVPIAILFGLHLLISDVFRRR